MKRYALGFYQYLPSGVRALVKTGPVPADFESVWLHVPASIGYEFVIHGVKVDSEAVDAWTGPVLASCMGDATRFDLSFEAPAGSVVGLEVENVGHCAHEFRATLMGEVRR